MANSIATGNFTPIQVEYLYPTASSNFYMTHDSTTFYRKCPVHHVSNNSGFVSADTDLEQITLQAGTYVFDIPIGCGSNTGWLDFKLVNQTDSATALEITNAVYNIADDDISFSNISGAVKIDAAKTFEYFIQADFATGTTYTGVIKITKIR